MITPKEIEEKDFTKTFRGYSEDEVDEFLDRIILDIQALQEENAALKEDNERLRKENLDHKDSQVSVMHTLDQAKKLMQDISESAEKRADSIIRNAITARTALSFAFLLFRRSILFSIFFIPILLNTTLSYIL